MISTDLYNQEVWTFELIGIVSTLKQYCLELWEHQDKSTQE